MIKTLALRIAAGLGITGLEIATVEGRQIGCLDADLMYLIVNGTKIVVLVFHHEKEQAHQGLRCLSLETRIHSVLSSHLSN